MSLVTWQAIGAVVLILIFTTALILSILVIGPCLKDDDGEIGDAFPILAVNYLIWGIAIVITIGYSWNTIGIGLFGVSA